MLRYAKFAAAIVLSLALGTGAARAASIDIFTFTSPEIVGTLTTSIASSPTPASFVSGVSFDVSNVSLVFEGTPLTGTATFFTAGGAGGGGVVFNGPLLFSGPVSAPTFNLGTFTLSGIADLGNGGPESVTGTLTISAASPTVPEPLPLALTGTGMLALFEILRRRRAALRTGEIHC